MAVALKMSVVKEADGGPRRRPTLLVPFPRRTSSVEDTKKEEAGRRRNRLRRPSLLVPFPRRTSEATEEDGDDAEDPSRGAASGEGACAEDENARRPEPRASSFESIDDDGCVGGDELNDGDDEDEDEALAGEGDEASAKAAQQLLEMVPGTNDDDANVDADETCEGRRADSLGRLRTRDDSAFGHDCVPREREREREDMDAIREFLALRDPRTDPSYYFPNENGQHVTKRAIGSLFFAEPAERPRSSVLLKRGHVLLNGRERELLAFAGGFLFANVEMDSLVRLLVDGGGSEATPSPTAERRRERFRGIDTHCRGHLDREDIHVAFEGMDIPLSAQAVDRIANEYASDADDGTLSWSDFESMARDVRTRELRERRSNSSWRSLGTKLRGALNRNDAARKLDVAFRTTDVEKIENLGMCHSDKTRAYADAEWAHLTLALHVRGTALPLLVTCAGPRQVEAWMEAFRACVAGEGSAPGPTGSTVAPNSRREASHPGVIWGVREPENKKVQFKRSSLVQWSMKHGTSVNWDWEEED